MERIIRHVRSFRQGIEPGGVVEALRHRRSYAVRGGEPVLVDFRVNGVFQGGEVDAGSGPPNLSVKVKARSPVEKIEVVRNGAYVYTHTPGGDTAETEFSYRDTAGGEPGTYYYMRVWMKGRQPMDASAAR